MKERNAFHGSLLTRKAFLSFMGRPGREASRAAQNEGPQGPECGGGYALPRVRKDPSGGRMLPAAALRKDPSAGANLIIFQGGYYGWREKDSEGVD